MKIGVVGATGKAGSFIVKEALNRGHDVTAIVRDASKVEERDVHTLEKDIFDITEKDIEGFDAVVNAFGAPEGKEHLHVEAGQSLIHVFKQAPDVRLLVVGGAGSLFVDEEKTTRLADTPDFPKEYKATADNQTQNLKDLESTSDVNWTFISPAAFFNPSGKRTDAYKTGK
ncbi:MAG: NAD(P)H-binding protein, partial [Priestia megaterium]